jgi:hypothetical protein
VVGRVTRRRHTSVKPESAGAQRTSEQETKASRVRSGFQPGFSAS